MSNRAGQQARLGELNSVVRGISGRPDQAPSRAGQGTSLQPSIFLPLQSSLPPTLPAWFNEEEIVTPKEFSKAVSGSRVVHLIKERAPRWAFQPLECGELCYRVR